MVAGYAFDESSKPHLDVNLSFKYLLYDSDMKTEKGSEDSPTPVAAWQFYAAFATRFSQYVGTRNSSPVVGRRYNLECFMRWNRRSSSFDAGYGHESNGQDINSNTEFTAKQASLAGDGDDPNSALEYVSRGWDYLGFGWEKEFNVHDTDLRTNVQTRFFLSHGFLQGAAEDYYAFERSGRMEKRSRYDGIRLSLISDAKNHRSSWALRYHTGYSNPLRHNTIRIEYTRKWRYFPPIAFWAQTGYNSDLAHYYKRLHTVGVGVHLNF